MFLHEIAFSTWSPGGSRSPGIGGQRGADDDQSFCGFLLRQFSIRTAARVPLSDPGNGLAGRVLSEPLGGDPLLPAGNPKGSRELYLCIGPVGFSGLSLSGLLQQDQRKGRRQWAAG